MKPGDFVLYRGSLHDVHARLISWTNGTANLLVCRVACRCAGGKLCAIPRLGAMMHVGRWSLSPVDPITALGLIAAAP